MRTLSASHTLIAAAGVALCLLSSCVLRPGTVVSRFSGEFICPEKQVVVEKLDKDRFRATGCHRRANYRCSGEYGEFCERLGQPETLGNPSVEVPQTNDSQLAVPPQG